MKEMNKCGLCGKPLHSGLETFGEFGDVPQCSGCWYGMTEEGEEERLWRDDEKRTPQGGYKLVEESASSIVEINENCPECEANTMYGEIVEWDAITGKPETVFIHCHGASGMFAKCSGPDWDDVAGTVSTFIKTHRIDTQARRQRRMAVQA